MSNYGKLESAAMFGNGLYLYHNQVNNNNRAMAEIEDGG